MSEWFPKVVRIDNPVKVPNSDTLSMITVDGGYPIVYKTDQFSEGDLVAYIPIDSIVPDTEEWKFLGGKNRIRARRFCGQFSMGTLAPLPPGDYQVDQDVTELMGLTKYEPPMEFASGDSIRDPQVIEKYTDIEGFRKYKKLFEDGEEVVVLEKVHGCNARAVVKEGVLYIGSHHTMKKYPGETQWSFVIDEYGLQEKFARYDGYCFYYEVYGPSIQGNKFAYGTVKPNVIFFDISKDGVYLDWDETQRILTELELPITPILYRGPMHEGVLELSNGPSLVPGAKNIREGFVIKPVKEEFAFRFGRKILKFIGEDYQLLK